MEENIYRVLFVLIVIGFSGCAPTSHSGNRNPIAHHSGVSPKYVLLYHHCSA